MNILPWFSGEPGRRSPFSPSSYVIVDWKPGGLIRGMRFGTGSVSSDSLCVNEPRADQWSLISQLNASSTPTDLAPSPLMVMGMSAFSVAEETWGSVQSM